MHERNRSVALQSREAKPKQQKEGRGEELQHLRRSEGARTKEIWIQIPIRNFLMCFIYVYICIYIHIYEEKRLFSSLMLPGLLMMIAVDSVYPRGDILGKEFPGQKVYLFLYVCLCVCVCACACSSVSLSVSVCLCLCVRVTICVNLENKNLRTCRIVLIALCKARDERKWWLLAFLL